jgi:hypothetical protein
MNSIIFALCTVVFYASECANAAIVRTRPEESANEYAPSEHYSPELAQLAQSPEVQAYYYQMSPYALQQDNLPVNENMAVTEEDLQEPQKRAQSFVRFGKRAQSFVRFGKRAQSFVRFGKRAQSFVRFGKRAQSFVRFGRSGHKEMEQQ